MADDRDAERVSDDAPRIRKTGRRVRTEPVEGYIGEPVVDESDDRRSRDGENDARLIGDKPPHWA